MKKCYGKRVWSRKVMRIHSIMICKWHHYIVKKAFVIDRQCTSEKLFFYWIIPFLTDIAKLGIKNEKLTIEKLISNRCAECLAWSCYSNFHKNEHNNDRQIHRYLLVIDTFMYDNFIMSTTWDHSPKDTLSNKCICYKYVPTNTHGTNTMWFALLFFSFYNTSILNIEYRFPSNTEFSHEVLQHCEDNRCLDEKRKCIKSCHVSNFFTAQPFIWGMISRPWRFRLRRTIAVSAGSRRFRLMHTIAAPNICRSWQIVKMLSTSALIIGPSIITVISWNS